MKMKGKAIYSTSQKAWGILMIFALLWLTVSLPFVIDAKERLAQKTAITTPADDTPAENSENANPLSNSVEEKAGSSSTSVLEEYLYHTDELVHVNNPRLSHIDKHSTDLYSAYHGELLSPPPESLL